MSLRTHTLTRQAARGADGGDGNSGRVGATDASKARPARLADAVAADYCPTASSTHETNGELTPVVFKTHDSRPTTHTFFDQPFHRVRWPRAQFVKR